MSAIRRGLRCYAMVWLLFQAADVCALVPRCCCAPPAEKPPAAEATTCHETAAAETSVPPPEECVLRNGCTADAVAIASLLGNPGILPSAAVSPSLPDAVDRAPFLAEEIAGRLETPDSPPPRL